MTVWSPFVNHMRIGLDVWTDPIGPGTTSTNVYVRTTVQVDSTWNFADNQNAVLSGSVSANYPFYNGLQKNQTKVVGNHTIYNQGLSGGGPTYNFTARLDGIYLGGGPSVSTSFTLPARPAPPARVPSPPPAPDFHEISATGVNVTWGLPADGGTSALDRTRFQLATANFDGVVYDNETAGWNGRTVGGLAPGRTYFGRSLAHNAAGWSAWSPVSSFVTNPYETPSPTVRVSTTTAEVIWAAPAVAPDPVRFQLQAADNDGFANPVELTDNWTTSMNVGNLVPGRRYFFRVRSDSGSGWGLWSGVTEVTTEPLAPLPAPPPREPGSSWSFLAQRASTGEWIDWDIPIEIEGMEWQLSGPGSLKGTVAPDVGGLRASDGRPVLEEWGTLLYAESGGEIRWAGILISCSFEGEEWHLEAAGFSTYPHKRIYKGEYSAIDVDPFVAFQHIWEHIQSTPGGNLGVFVTGTPTPVRMGTAAWTETTTETDGTVRETVHDADPYELLWFDHPNCGGELDELTKGTPFDWVEKHYWSPDRENVVHEIQVAYPRIGRRRDDLSFVQGDNVSNVLVIESNGDEFANTIIGLGAGEGRAMLRRETAIQDGRLVVDSVFADKAITDTARLDANLAEELNARKPGIRITSFDVTDHPNAPLGSWQLGDDVLVRAEVPWLGEIELWVRITGWTLTGENTASLEVQRSDFYRYGGTS